MRTRTLMRHRAVVERLTRTSDGGGGSTEAWNSGETIPCRAWFQGSVAVATNEHVTIEDTRVVITPLSSSIHEGDRLTSVTDRRGRVILDGPLVIDTVGEMADHYKLITRRFS